MLDRKTAHKWTYPSIRLTPKSETEIVGPNNTQVRQAQLAVPVEASPLALVTMGVE